MNKKNKAKKKKLRKQSLENKDSQMPELKHFEDQQLMSNLFALVESGKFSDLVLQTRDGHEFNVHRNILGTTSAYFWDEFHSSDQRDRTILEVDVEALHLKVILKAIYSGKADFPKEMAREIYVIAQRFQLETLREFCSEILESEVAQQNCLELFEFSVSNSADNLRAKCMRIFLENADNLMETFISPLSVGGMTIFLSEPEALRSIQNQEKLLENLTNWVKEDFENREDLLNTVIAAINFNFISYRFIKKLLTSKVLKRNKDFLPGIMIIMFDRIDRRPSLEENLQESSFDQVASQAASTVQANSCPQTVSPFRTVSYAQIAWSSLAASPSQVSSSDQANQVSSGNKKIFMVLKSKIQKFNFPAQKWENHFDFENENTNGFSCCEYGNKIYISGGRAESYFHSTISHQFSSFCAYSNTFESLSSMLCSREWHQMATVNNKIYACGGLYANCGRNSLKTEFYDIELSKWVSSVPMLEQKWCFGLTNWENCLYAVGGNSNSIEMLDVRGEQSWIRISQIPHNLKECKSIIHNGNLFCFNSKGGGSVFDIRSRICIRVIFEVSTNELWSKFDIAELNGQIYGIFCDSYTYEMKLCKFNDSDWMWECFHEEKLCFEDVVNLLVLDEN